MNTYFKIVTQSDKAYLIDKDRQIIRMDMLLHGAPDWTFKGLVNRYGHVIDIASIHGLCRYKNGKGMYWLIDQDHGTLRQWSDRIVYIYPLTLDEFNKDIEWIKYRYKEYY